MHISLHSIRSAARVIGMTSALVGTVGLAGASASTASYTGSNTITGASSLNQNALSLSDIMAHNTYNNGFATTSLAAGLTTGGNATMYNTTVGSAGGSGAINLLGGVSNVLNAGAAAGSTTGLGNTMVFGGGTNGTTGANSTNTNSVNVVSRQNQAIFNTATAITGVNATLNSGGNSTVGNTTVAGNGGSGNITVNAQVANRLNSGAGAALAAPAQTTVTSTGGNNTTGFNSLNQNTVNVTSEQNSEVRNNAAVTTQINVNADSGHNNTSYNTTVGGTSSGDINAGFVVVNDANNQ